MPPFVSLLPSGSVTASSTLAQVTPILELKRQDSQSSDSVTLSITRAYTTYTTTILLGATPLPAVATGNAVITIPQASAQAGPPQGAIVGISLGTILGIFLLITLIWTVCVRSARNQRSFWEERSDHSSSRYGSRISSTRSRSRPQVGGWNWFGGGRGRRVKRRSRRRTFGETASEISQVRRPLRAVYGRGRGRQWRGDFDDD